jgi:hypothetical protein
LDQAADLATVEGIKRLVAAPPARQLGEDSLNLAFLVERNRSLERAWYAVAGPLG